MIKDLLASLSARGIRLELFGTTVRIIAPTLTQQDRKLLADELRPRKAELVEYLSKEQDSPFRDQGDSLPASRAGQDSGYEVSPGICIHPPKTSEEFLRWREKMSKKPR